MVDNVPNYSMKSTFFQISQGIGSAMAEGAKECIPTIVSGISQRYAGIDPFLNSPPSMGTIMEYQMSGGYRKKRTNKRSNNKRSNNKRSNNKRSNNKKKHRSKKKNKRNNRKKIKTNKRII